MKIRDGANDLARDRENGIGVVTSRDLLMKSVPRRIPLPGLSRYAGLLACLAVTLSRPMPACAAGKNLVAGTWIMVSAQADPGGANKPLFGPHPNGLLVFTDDLHFADVLINPDVPRFASSDRAGGTDLEDKAVVTRDLALYGTYTVDEQGRFATEHVTASTFPNWNGLERDTRTITEVVEGDTMTERLKDPGGPQIVIVWRRAR